MDGTAAESSSVSPETQRYLDLPNEFDLNRQQAMTDDEELDQKREMQDDDRPSAASDESNTDDVADFSDSAEGLNHEPFTALDADPPEIGDAELLGELNPSDAAAFDEELDAREVAAAEEKTAEEAKGIEFWQVRQAVKEFAIPRAMLTVCALDKASEVIRAIIEHKTKKGTAQLRYDLLMAAHEVEEEARMMEHSAARLEVVLENHWSFEKIDPHEVEALKKFYTQSERHKERFKHL